jgi:hypothetical protein
MTEQSSGNYREDYINQNADSLVAKKRLILTVDVSTREEAIEIISWMYSKEPPMKSKLQEVSWDRATVSAKQAELLQQLLETK